MGFEPEWQGVFENWTRAYMRVHHWKVEDFFTLDEAVQECAVNFSWCLRKTTSRGGRIDNAKWFMRYYQRSVGTWLITQANKQTGRREKTQAYFEPPPEETVEQAGPLVAALKRASPQLQTVLKVILSTPSEFFLDLLLRPGPDHIWSRRLCRLCGVPVNENIIDELRRLLTE